MAALNQTRLGLPIDPQIAAGFALLEGLESYAEVFADPEKMARFEAAKAAPKGYVPPECEVETMAAAGPHGPVPLRVYSRPGTSGLCRGLVWAHGGGWMAGDLDMPEADMVARELVHRADAVVVTVDYLLAVEGVTYPVPLYDVVAAWRWVADHADVLGLDPRELVLGGASAGGNLAAGAALCLRDEGDEVSPAGLLLAYPALHHPLPLVDAEREELLAALPRLV